MNSHNANLQAIFIVCASYLGFTVADTFSKYFAQFYSVHQILAYTGGLGMVISGLWVWKTLGVRGLIPAEKRKWHIIRAINVAAIPVSVISALKYLPMADYYGISFCAPFLILIMSALFLKEHIGIARWAAVIVGFMGVLVLAGPKYNDVGPGVLYALSAAFFVALSVITVRKIGPHAPTPHYIFFPFIATFSINFIIMLVEGNHIMPPLEHLMIFPLSILFVIGGQLGFAIGHARATSAGVTAPFLYTQIIWGVLLGWIVFGDFPVVTTWIGLSIVIGAGLFSIWRERRLARRIIRAG